MRANRGKNIYEKSRLTYIWLSLDWKVIIHTHLLSHMTEDLCGDALFSFLFFFLLSLCIMSVCVRAWVCFRTSFTAEEENEVDVSPSYTEETQMELLSHLFPPQT